MWDRYGVYHGLHQLDIYQSFEYQGNGNYQRIYKIFESNVSIGCLSEVVPL